MSSGDKIPPRRSGPYGRHGVMRDMNTLRAGWCVVVTLLALAWGARAEEAAWAERAVSADGAALPAGAVWFRAYVKVPDAMAGGDDTVDLWRDSMTMTLRDLPGPVVVMLNGRTILETKDGPADAPRRFKVPKGI